MSSGNRYVFELCFRSLGITAIHTGLRGVGLGAYHFIVGQGSSLTAKAQVTLFLAF